ncbi:MAG: hypothetical protein VW908_04685 [Flavobacteriaceae bacterium]
MKKSLIYSVISLLVIGLGLSLLGEAIISKWNNFSNWVWLGTLALVVCNTGFSLLGRAVIEKIRDQK